MDVEQKVYAHGRVARDFGFEEDFRMRTIGMIGGMSWESSAIY
jgi:hypothetical protein